MVFFAILGAILGALVGAAAGAGAGLIKDEKDNVSQAPNEQNKMPWE